LPLVGGVVQGCNRQKGNNIEVCNGEEEILLEKNNISFRKIKTLF